MPSWVGAIFAIIKVIPALKGWFDWFVAEYTRREIDGMKKEIREGIRRAVEEQDQRDLERAINSPLAGKPSGKPGAVIVSPDDLPDIVPHKKRD
jgi:hypothetical protein